MEKGLDKAIWKLWIEISVWEWSKKAETAGAKVARQWADQSTAEGAGVPGIATWVGMSGEIQHDAQIRIGKLQAGGNSGSSHVYPLGSRTSLTTYRRHRFRDWYSEPQGLRSSRFGGRQFRFARIHPVWFLLSAVAPSNLKFLQTKIWPR